MFHCFYTQDNCPLMPYLFTLSFLYHYTYSISTLFVFLQIILNHFPLLEWVEIQLVPLSLKRSGTNWCRDKALLSGKEISDKLSMSKNNQFVTAPIFSDIIKGKFVIILAAMSTYIRLCRLSFDYAESNIK